MLSPTTATRMGTRTFRPARETESLSVSPVAKTTHQGDSSPDDDDINDDDDLRIACLLRDGACERD
jgi:hypothetical protein